MKRLLGTLLNRINRRHAGGICAGCCFTLGLMWAVFGFWKTLGILVLTLLGYVFGVKVLANPDMLRRWVDWLLPPGRFR